MKRGTGPTGSTFWLDILPDHDVRNANWLDTPVDANIADEESNPEMGMVDDANPVDYDGPDWLADLQDCFLDPMTNDEEEDVFAIWNQE